MKIQDKNSKIIDTKVFARAQRHLEDIYLWPEKGKKLSFLKANILLLLSFMPIMAGIVGHIYKSIENHDTSAMLNDAVYLSLCFFYWATAGMYLCCSDEYVAHISKFNHHNFGIPENFEKKKIFLEKSNEDCFQQKQRGQLAGYICGMLCPSWYPIELGFSPWREVLFFHTFIICAYVLPKLTVCAVPIFGSVVLTADKIDHLSSLIERAKNIAGNTSLIEKELRLYVRYYAEIVGQVNEINTVIGFILSATQNSLNVIILALLEYEAIMENNWKSFCILGFCLTVEAGLCYGGQLLENSSDSLHKNVYEFPWYNLHPSVRTNFKIFHAYTQRTLQFKVQPIKIVNLVQFYTVMKGSYSFLMFLKNI